MARYRSSRILPIILILVIAVIVIVAIVSLVRVIFSSGSSPAPTQADTSRTSLLDTSETRSVTMTVRGPIVADEDFHTYTISISPESRTLTTFTGYNATPDDNVALSNNTAAYTEFVNALDKANFEKGTQLSGDANDLQGRCAIGQVYDFQILDGGTVVKELWTSTCSGSKGSLNASVAQLLNLFQAQIPNAQTTIRKVNLQ